MERNEILKAGGQTGALLGSNIADYRCQILE